MKNKIFLFSLIAGIAVIAIVAAGWLFRGTACRDFGQGTVRVDNQEISVAIARTDIERARGLGGCTSLPKKSGMYFPYESKQQAQFWMKGMLVPLDIIWIADGRVIGINDHVPPPPPGLDVDPPRYRPPAPVDGVLEIAAGAAAELGIRVGSTVAVSQ